MLDGKFPLSVINGFDESHLVENITIENISVQRKKIGSEEELKLVSKYARNIQIR